MKWFFLLLIVANLALFLWGVQKEKATQSQENILEPGKGNLRMLSELEQAERQALDNSTDDQKPPAEALPVEESQQQAQAQTTESDNQPGPTVVETIKTPEPLPDQRINRNQENTFEISDSERIQRRKSALPEKPTDAALNGDLQVKSESRSELFPTATPTEKTVAQTQDSKVPTAPEPICGKLGPLTDKRQITQITKALSAEGADVTPKDEVGQKNIGFWVTIPPLESREAAIAQVISLRKAGVTDMARFTKGDRINGISLGVFSRKGNAEKRRQEIAKKGFKAELLQRTKPVNQTWLEYKLESGVDATAIEKILKRYPAVKKEQKSCE